MKISKIKLQYNNYEAGEFSDIRECNVDEAIEQIKQFSWEKERALSSIGYTCPSVTVEDNEGNYIKIAPFYNGKYVAYYLPAGEKHVCQKSLTDLHDACEEIKRFYEQALDGYKKQLFRGNILKHFVTAEFNYSINQKRVILYSIWPIGVTVTYLLLYLMGYKYSNKLEADSLLIFAWTVTTGINVILLINYILHDKRINIKISAGNETILFGNGIQQKTYRKENVNKVQVYQIPFLSSGFDRCPWGNYMFYVILFNDHTTIKFTSLLIGYIDFERKFDKSKIEYRSKYFPLTFTAK
ncbi:MAG: hypothetical protein H0X33_04080 [Taibaiella sp.]|nr:hypothetical protein [Taibaiella sp.]